MVFGSIYVTERSRKLLRDVRLRGGLKVRFFSALSYFFVQWRFPNEKLGQEDIPINFKEIVVFCGVFN